MSWLAKSIANSLKIDNDDDTQNNNTSDEFTSIKSPTAIGASSSAPSTPSARGVKEDISELRKTLTHQFWGVASFLAPPPPPPPESSSSSPNDSTQISDSVISRPTDQVGNDGTSDLKVSDEDMISGIRNDFAEIGGRFKTGISKLSTNKAVSEFTKIASNLLLFGEDEEEEFEVRGVVGVTDEVLAFARNISLHPETWLDFPLSDDEDSDDFNLSDAQQEHALAVEQLAPTLAALRIELCPEHMSESYFWKIYFVLLYPRLCKEDAHLLSTPQIVEARAILSQELQSRTKVQVGKDSSQQSIIYSKGIPDPSEEEHLSVLTGAQTDVLPIETLKTESACLPEAVDAETDKHAIEDVEIKIIDKPVVSEGPMNRIKYQESTSGSSSKVIDVKFEDDADDWLKEDNSEAVSGRGTSIPIGNDEDVSFSDLEDDDEEVPSSYKKVAPGSDSSAKDSRDWVQLSRSSIGSDKDLNSVEIRHSGSDRVSGNNENKDSNDWLDVDDIDVV